MRRHAIALIVVLLLAGAIVLWLWPPIEGGYPMLEAVCWRVGAVMAVLWLAYPDVKRLPPWLFGVVPILIVLLAARPRWFIYLVPVVLVIGVLRSWKRKES